MSYSLAKYKSQHRYYLKKKRNEKQTKERTEGILLEMERRG